MKILVTGGNGFIGSAYIKEIEKEGHECINYDLPDNDILNLEILFWHIEQCDMVVHFAAIADLNDSIKNQDKNFDVNIKGTYNIGMHCARLKKKLIFISTCCVYGNTGDDEETEAHTVPDTYEPYACSKMAGEYILKGIPDLEYVVLRIGTTYGIGMREALFTYIVLDSVLKGKKINIHGTGDQTRNLIYIDDLVEGIKLTTDQFDDVMGQTINLCSHDQISANDCITVAEGIIGKEAIFTHTDDRFGQILSENISNGKAYILLGWNPPTDKFYERMRYIFHNDERFKK